MTSNERQLEDVLSAINGSKAEDLAIYTAYVGLLDMRERRTAAAITELRWQGARTHPVADATAAKHHMESWLVRGGGVETAPIPLILAGIAALESDPEFAGAVARLQPLCDERDRLRVVIAEDEATARKLHQDLIDAEAAATAAAIAAANASPAVVKARKALEAATK